MSKNYEATNLKNLGLRIKLSTVADPIMNSADGKFYAAYQAIHATGTNGIVKTKPQSITRYYGQGKDRPWTAKEVGNAIKNFSNLNTVLYNDIKQLYLDLINEDIQ